mmetsp:Transcript_118232/g.367615  ORF Transcript_118232/g.367615 Transcript_118232/m.367615 type:complete len:242 (+) Transcript_118232:84-809(+)
MKTFTATMRRTPEVRGASQPTSRKATCARRGSSAAASGASAACRAAEGTTKKPRQRATAASSSQGPRPVLSSRRKPRFSCESKNWMQRCSCDAVRWELTTPSARRCFSSAYCAGLPRRRTCSSAGLAPRGPGLSSMRCRSSSRSTAPQAAPSGRPGTGRPTVAACSERPPPGESSFSPALASSWRSKPVVTRKEASVGGSSWRTPTIRAASERMGHCACSAKAARCAQFSSVRAPTSVSWA